MLDVVEKPRLLITRKDAAHVYGVCSLCEHRLHVFIRNTEQQARLLLNRGFKLHCRGRHEVVVSIPTKVSTARRSTRVAADVLIQIQTKRFRYAGETISVNLHGALVRVAGPLKHGDRVRIHVHRTGKSAGGKIVFTGDALRQFGIELDCPENIWGLTEQPTDWTASAS